MEQWRDIPDYEGRYQVSDHGRIRSLLTSRIMSLSLDRYGYKFVRLVHQSGVRPTVLVHRAVLAAFYKPSRRQINHRNGCKTDNRPQNLEYCSALANQMHALKTGLKGSFTPNQIRAIRKDKRQLKEIGAEYGVTGSNIWYIRHRKSWQWVT